MTDEELRRIRRIVAGDPQQPPPPLPVDPRHAERFQRALGTVRRATMPMESVIASPAVPASPAAAAASASTAPAAVMEAPAPPRRKDAARAEKTPATEARSAHPPIQAARSVQARETAFAETAAEAAMPDEAVVVPDMPIPVVAWTPLPEGWETSVADTVASLCRGSDPAFHSWTIQVPLDGDALPHTELRLTFSPHHLLLRFSTQSTRSLALISARQSQLRDLLSRALPDQRHIDIDIT